MQLTHMIAPMLLPAALSTALPELASAPSEGLVMEMAGAEEVDSFGDFSAADACAAAPAAMFPAAAAAPAKLEPIFRDW